MLVGSIRRILHDANVHRFTDRYSNRLSRFVIDEARRTLEEDIVWVLENIELAKELQRVVAAPLDRKRQLNSPAPPQPTTLSGRLQVAVMTDAKTVPPVRRTVGRLSER